MQEYSSPKKMKTVGDLFLKYKLVFKPPQATVEKAFIEVVKEVLGFDLDIKMIKYNVGNRTLGLTVPSILKTEVKFKQKIILEKMSIKLGKGNSPETII